MTSQQEARLRFRSKEAQSREHLICCAIDRLVLPDSERSPPGSLEVRIHLGVTCSVTSDLFLPVGGVGTWTRVVLRASVPVATVHEHCEPGAAKDKVRGPWMIEQGLRGYPIPQTSGVQRSP